MYAIMRLFEISSLATNDGPGRLPTQIHVSIAASALKAMYSIPLRRFFPHLDGV